MSEEPKTRIWTQKGFIEDRFTSENGTITMSPEEATGKLGSGSASVLVLEAGDEAGAVATRIQEFDAVFVRFPAFGDGRGFSTARLLREKYEYRGEVRAVGNYILDQIPLMLRVGFDSFAVHEEAIIARLEKNELPEVPLYLQPAFGAEEKAGERAWARRRGG